MDKKTTHILGAKLDLKSREEIRSLISLWLRSDGPTHHIVTLNPEICLKAEKDEHYRRQILNKADLTIMDGVGLILGAKILGSPYPERITGRQIVSLVFSEAVRESKSVFLLGGGPGIAEKAKSTLNTRFPQLQISGVAQGPSEGEFTTETPQLVDEINASNASILLVAFGAPKQEQWIQENLSRLKQVKIAIGVGGLLDYLADEVPSPPDWVSKIGMEWFYRLVSQSNRLKRILNAVFSFPMKCIQWRWRIHSTYRKNVVGVIQNTSGEVLLVSPSWSKTLKWQFPQGGVDDGEDSRSAILREMSEELGTDKFIIKRHEQNMYTYDWPAWYQLLRGYKGQKQDVFVLEYTGGPHDIDLTVEKELATYKWSTVDHLMDSLAPARREIGKIVLKLLQKN